MPFLTADGRTRTRPEQSRRDAWALGLQVNDARRLGLQPDCPLSRRDWD